MIVIYILLWVFYDNMTGETLVIHTSGTLIVCA